jgi:hypothetical protein
MFFLIGRLRAKKRVKQANQKISQTQFLLEAHGADLSVDERKVIVSGLQQCVGVSPPNFRHHLSSSFPPFFFFQCR